MIRALLLSELQQYFGGERLKGDVAFTGIETDSRANLSGNVFLALKGERFDGHLFCQQAQNQGAVGLVVSDYQPDIDLPQWLVPDTRIALGQIATYNRGLFTGPVIAITGNSGKTTVKEMLGAILTEAVGQNKVLITAGNFNNDIGVPLTLMRLSEQHQYAVIELGANHLGEIDYCGRIARPDIGVVLNVTGAHLGEFGSMQQIAQAKGELIQVLGSEGKIVVNYDDAFVDYWISLAGERLLTGYSMLKFDSDQAVIAEESEGNSVERSVGSSVEKIDLYATDLQVTECGYRFNLCVSDRLADARHLSERRIPVQLQVPARHNVSNALAAASAALQLGLDLTCIAQGLNHFSGVSGRLQTVTGLQQSRIINDSYNANPGSVRAAIDTLMDYSGEHILVLGDIGELGAATEQAHQELGIYAKAKGVGRLLTIGQFTALTCQAFGSGAEHFADKASLIAAIKPHLKSDTTLLVKGSRSSKMELVVAGLTL